MASIPYTRAYLHHLFKQNEPLRCTLASLHLLHEHLMRELRGRILRDGICY